MNHNDTLKTFLKSVIGNKCINANDQVLNDFLQHVEEIMKDPSKCINVLEKELSAATNDYLSAINCNCSDYKKEKLDSAQAHLDNIIEMMDFHNLYIDLREFGITLLITLSEKEKVITRKFVSL